MLPLIFPSFSATQSLVCALQNLESYSLVPCNKLETHLYLCSSSLRRETDYIELSEEEFIFDRLIKIRRKSICSYWKVSTPVINPGEGLKTHQPYNKSSTFTQKLDMSTVVQFWKMLYDFVMIWRIYIREKLPIYCSHIHTGITALP